MSTSIDTSVLSQPLTAQDGVTLREDVRDYGALHGDRPLTVGSSIRTWRQYIAEKDGAKTIFENEDGDTIATEQPHRFAPEYADKQYAKLNDLERGTARDYGKRQHVAMLTLSASARPDGEPIPPVDHLEELDSSWNAVTTALDRVLEGKRYERLAILEPHPGGGPNTGYFHIHLAVFVDGRVAPGRFEPVIRAHVDNCDLAEWAAHDLEDDRTVSVRHAGRDRDLEDDDAIDELAIYLAEYLGTYGDDPLDAPGFVQMANTILWATGKQRWRPSNGAQQYMALDRPDEPSQWELVAVEIDGQRLEVRPEDGGVDRFTTSTDPPPEPGGSVQRHSRPSPGPSPRT